MFHHVVRVVDPFIIIDIAGVGARHGVRGRMLGSGVMSVCMDAPVLAWGCDVVVKQVLRCAEREVLQRLAICRVKGVVQWLPLNSGTGIVMPLLTCLANRSHLDDEGRLLVGRQLLAALRDVHAVGVLHCDVKPHNVLLTEQYEAVLGDFGSAVLDADSDDDETQNDENRHSFSGTRMFCVSSSAPPSRMRDIQSLCYSLVWLRRQWHTNKRKPSWRSVLEDPVACVIWREWTATVE
jgi:hypothetical protein